MDGNKLNTTGSAASPDVIATGQNLPVTYPVATERINQNISAIGIGRPLLLCFQCHRWYGNHTGTSDEAGAGPFHLVPPIFLLCLDTAG